ATTKAPAKTKTATKSTGGSAATRAALAKAAAKQAPTKAKPSAAKAPAKAKAPTRTTATGKANTSARAATKPKDAAPPRMRKPKTPDDLKMISGVGPKIEGILNGLGIYKFEQVAKWRKAERAWVDDHLRFKGRIEREDWVKQAKALAKGGRDEYVRVFGKEPR
ncbi:MAG: NADH dehydrogenase subunit E, partial [Pseudomonadota bacterium]